MRLWIVMLVGVALVLGGCKTEQTESKEVSVETLQQRVSYSVGLDVARNFKENEFELDTDLILQGIKDAQSGAQPRMSEEQIASTMEEFQQHMMEQYQQRMAKQSTENATKEADFLAENSKKEGVVTLESGLQYKVVEAGSGASPTAEDTVRVDYRGTLLDGTEFDSSYKRGEPAEFQVNRVIPGWTEALQLMKEGATWELYIPAKLAYGERGMGQVIAPNSMLIFEVKFHSIVDGEEAPAAAAE
ncbi:FKBP-type peptidyl-prolyl cis-trans isomerase [uncultured Desulfuromonas sp.]|uniref:FKBP-type peptidyl-prolyl cis-trans isomerase n=1 Tax=uncultured Desulfuromonas sp. TaxID=181013 RepID=UPI002AAC3E30|nr:FKBP-type peptidyl-prolyl cis-trans isomerase [uncultured Desulfuromonas sp.]